MKKSVLFSFFLLLAFWQTSSASQDTNVVWSTYISCPSYDMFNSPDGMFIYINQNDCSRFLKIDALTGKVIDSIGGKGIISGFSPDWKYIYTHYSTFESIE